MRLSILCLALAICNVSVSPANAVTLTDLEHGAFPFGNWANSSPGTYGIWVATGTDPTTTVAGDFLNPGNPTGQQIPLGTGTHDLLFFKESIGSLSSTYDNLHFDIGTISLQGVTVLSGYQTTNGSPQSVNQLVTGGGRTVSIVHMSWYKSDVFSRDLVGPGKNFGPSGGLDDVAIVRLHVIPEPGSIALLVLGMCGISILRRYRR
jgi:hypothetical protein